MTITGGRPFTVAEWRASRSPTAAVAAQERPHWRRGYREPRPFAFDALERLLVVRSWAAASDVARGLGVNRRQVHRWRASGLTAAQADRYAVPAGYHPSDVWGDAWWRYP